jgi:hypothetical protein
MLPIMETIAKFLSCNLLTYKTSNLKQELTDTYSVSVTRLDQIKPLIFYFNKYPLLGIKGKDFKD